MREIYLLNMWRDRARIYTAGLIADMEAVLHHNQVVDADGFDVLLRHLEELRGWLALPFERTWQGYLRGLNSKRRLNRVSKIAGSRLRNLQELLEWWH